MPDFEDQLRAALARREPPDGFAKRVAARANGTGHARKSWKPWATGLIAASLFGSVYGIQEYQHHRDREKGLEARAQLLQALQITGSKLERIHKKVESTYQ